MSDPTIEALERRIADLEARLREKPRRATAPVLHIKTGDGHLVEAPLDYWVTAILNALDREALVAVLRKVAALTQGVGVRHWRAVSMADRPPTQIIQVPGIPSASAVGTPGRS